MVRTLKKASTTTISTTTLPFLEAYDIYHDAWHDFVIENKLNPSLLPGWLHCVFKAFNNLEDVFVFVAKDHEGIIAIQPYYISKSSINGVKLTNINMGGNLVSYHQEFTICDHYENFIADFNASLPKWDILTFSNADIAGQAYMLLQDYSAASGAFFHTYPGETSPYILINNSWPDYLATKRRKFRYKVNKHEKDLASNSDFEIKWYTETTDNIDLLIRSIFSIEEKSWKTNNNMDITSNQVEMNYYKLLIPYLAKMKLLNASLLFYKNNIIAYNLCYKINNKVGQIKTSFDDDFKEISPGALLIEDSLRKYFSNDVKEFDFLGDIMQHKMSLATDTREHATAYVINNSPKGIFYKYYLKLRSLIKKLIRQ